MLVGRERFVQLYYTTIFIFRNYLIINLIWVMKRSRKHYLVAFLHSTR